MSEELDEPTFQRRLKGHLIGDMEWEREGQIGVAHEVRPTQPPQPALQWTRQAPSQPGWYWRRTHQGTNMGVVEVKRKGLNVLTYEEVDVRGYLGFWAGPIPEPTD